MNVFNRAFVSIKRNIWKSITLFSLLFLLSSLMVGAILTRSSIHATDENLRAQLPAVATIPESHFIQLDPQVIRQVGDLPYVRAFDYSFTTILNSRELEMVQLEGSDSEIGMAHTFTEG